jgi:tetratricopeptide (TPR) repeat protein
MLSQILRERPLAFFVGAGISRAAPASAPLWKEMQAGCISAMYARMLGQPWVERAEFFSDDEVLRGFRFRPESFWEVVLRETSLGVVAAAFQVLSSGRPNLNHYVLARLLASDRIAEILSPNFDEYLEAAAGSATKIVKIHGTLGSPESLQFTLTHTRSLPEETARLLQQLLSGGVVIAGYSGNDDDIMPHLRELAAHVDPMIVFLHPEASSDEPVRTLAGPGVRFIDADINEELRELAFEMGLPAETIVSEADSHQGAYANALARMPVVTTVLAVAALHQFTGNVPGQLKYGHLAEDICDDKRYAEESRSYLGRAEGFVRAAYAADGDVPMARATGRPESPRSVLHQQLDVCFSILQQGDPSPEQLEFLELVLPGAALYSDHTNDLQLRFRGNWYLGRFRRTQHRFPEAFAAFERASDSGSSASHWDLVGFSLDYGVVYFEYALANENVGSLEEAARIFRTTWKIAKHIGDHQRAAQALLNLAHCYAVGYKNDEVPQFLAEADAEARLSGDQTLRWRLDEAKRILLDPER